MTWKITKSNQSEQCSDRGAKRSDRGGAYSGAPAYTLMLSGQLMILIRYLVLFLPYDLLPLV